MEYLLNSDMIRSKLLYVMGGPGKRTAIVAFVGRNPLQFLPKELGGLSVVCWPRAGGTHPDGIRALIDAGAMVQFCDRMHSKVYHHEERGAIVGSANLSNNALGENSLHEFAVYDDAPGFDINQSLKSLGRLRAVTKSQLMKLQEEHDQYVQKNGIGTGRAPEVKTFSEASAGRLPRAWKLVTWTAESDDDSYISAGVEAETGSRFWRNYNEWDPGVRFRKSDLVLQVLINEDDLIPGDRAAARWFRVDTIIPKNKTTSAIVQIDHLARANWPFKLDSKFRKAFRLVFNESSWEEIRDSKGYVRPRFIAKLRAQLLL